MVSLYGFIQTELDLEGGLNLSARWMASECDITLFQDLHTPLALDRDVICVDAKNDFLQNLEWQSTKYLHGCTLILRMQLLHPLRLPEWIFAQRSRCRDKWLPFLPVPQGATPSKMLTASCRDHPLDI